METMVIAVDFTASNQAIRDSAVPLAKKLNAHVHLVHAFLPATATGYEGYVPPPTEERLREQKALDDMITEFESLGLTDVTGAAEVGEPSETILRHAQKRDASLIVVGSHHHGFLHRLIFGSTSEKVVRKADRPVLVIPTD